MKKLLFGGVLVVFVFAVLCVGNSFAQHPDQLKFVSGPPGRYLVFVGRHNF